ncbi:MAG: glycerol-3-phosphate 1-O-acyltransferase PlsY [Alphaproteobacteria bacterium GM202ARS2]|nr:glycerol-3-phosphate 1-O-acyltransferase PlsY [Alphaproteobacteria bacterium GM202ARS2]
MVDMLQLLVLSGVFVGAYVVGSLPFGVMTSRLMGKSDPRASGSGNIGATNVARASGYGAGALTLLGDGGKGFIVLYGGAMVAPEPVALGIALIAVVLGHMFPFWLRFRGGKGVATTLGAALALSPFAFVGFLATWGSVLWITRYVSVASIISAWTLPLWLFAEGRPMTLVYASGVVAALVTFAHRSNIALLRRGEEEKMLGARET